MVLFENEYTHETNIIDEVFNYLLTVKGIFKNNDSFNSIYIYILTEMYTPRHSRNGNIIQYISNYAIDITLRLLFLV